MPKKYDRRIKKDNKKRITKKDLDQQILKIWDEHSRRLSGSYQEGEFSRSKNESAKSFLRREIYNLGLILEEVDLNWKLSDLVKDVRLNKVNREKPLDHIFHALFMSVYEEDSPISRQERWLMARELEYAQKHHISPELLCGFLLQSGPRKDLTKKLKQGYIEPSFRADEAE